MRLMIIFQIFLFNSKDFTDNVDYMLQNIVNTLSRILDLRHREQWQYVNKHYSGTVELLYYMEKYSITLAKNMHQLFMQPFDVVHDHVGM